MASKTELGQRSIDKRKAIIVSGFAAIGKTTFAKDAKVYKSTKMDIVDLDSSLYSKPNTSGSFPSNYEGAIRKAAEKPCIILISTHPGLPTRLAKEGYYVAVVYPGQDAKQEWLDRLQKRERGKKSRLYVLMEENWNLWFKRTAEEQVTMRRTLSKNEYLTNVFGSIYEEFLKWRSLKQNGNRGTATSKVTLGLPPVHREPHSQHTHK